MTETATATTTTTGRDLQASGEPGSATKTEVEVVTASSSGPSYTDTSLDRLDPPPPRLEMGPAAATEMRSADRPSTPEQSGRGHEPWQMATSHWK